MEYTFRELKASDLGAVCKILSSIGVKEFRSLDIPVGENVSQAEVGLAVAFGMAGIIMENMQKTQKDLDKFLASVCGMKVEEIQELSLGDYADLVIQVVQKEEFKDFFSHVVKLFNQ